MRYVIISLALGCVFAIVGLLAGASDSSGAEKSYYSPIIFVDKEKNRILISTSGAVFWIDVPEAARPHLDQLPIQGLADFVVETREGQAPLLKTWKVTAGDSQCKHFDGNNCH